MDVVRSTIGEMQAEEAGLLDQRTRRLGGRAPPDYLHHPLQHTGGSAAAADCRPNYAPTNRASARMRAVAESSTRIWSGGSWSAPPHSRKAGNGYRGFSIRPWMPSSRSTKNGASCSSTRPRKPPSAVPAAEAMGRPIEDFIPERFRARHAEHVRRTPRMRARQRVAPCPASANCRPCAPTARSSRSRLRSRSTGSAGARRSLPSSCATLPNKRGGAPAASVGRKIPHFVHLHC